MSTLSRKGTTKKRKDPGIPLFRYLDPPNDSSTPSRLSKNFCEEAVGYMGEIFKFVEEYNDTCELHHLPLFHLTFLSQRPRLHLEALQQVRRPD